MSTGTVITRRETVLVGLVRLLNNGNLATVVSGITSAIGGRTVDVKLVHNQLEITGPKDDVQAAFQYFRTSFTNKVAYDRVEITETDLNCDQFKSASSSTDLISELEKKHKCVIEVRTKGAKTFDEVLKHKSSASASTTQSAINVVEGSLTEFQADVLVNTIGTVSSDLSQCGPLCKAFMKAGGTELSKAYAATTVPTEFGSDVAVTDATGNLLAKKVYHAAMRKYRNRQSYQLLHNLICTCLKLAQADGLTSVAFPTIGCGNYGYQTIDVIDCFVRAADTVGGLQIYIVAFDNSIYEVFKEKCSRKAAESTLVVFHINAMTTDAVRHARDELKSRASNLRVSVPINNEIIGQLSPQAESDIKKLRTKDVQIKINPTKQRITVSAQNHKINATVSSISTILSQEQCRITDPQFIRQQHGVGAFLQALATQPIPYPPHWTPRSRDPKKSVWSDGHGQLVQLNSSDAVYAEIVQLVTGTWEPSVVGFGNDAKGLSHSSIAVRNVWRVENPKLYHKYRLKMKDMCQSAASKTFPLVKNLDNDEVKTRALNLKTLESALVPEINEYYLLHGTKADMHKVIAKQGLDSRLSASVYFGTGMYFAESSTKSDQYADNPQSRTPVGQSLYMYVVRVMLGSPYLARKPQAFRRPPCMQTGCNSDTCQTAQHDFHDSVLGILRPDGTRLLFREFVVYHPDQSYPEYLVEYVRQ